MTNAADSDKPSIPATDVTSSAQSTMPTMPVVRLCQPVLKPICAAQQQQKEQKYINEEGREECFVLRAARRR